jgi:hypothetical protein
MWENNLENNLEVKREDRERRRERERKDEEREGEGELERPGGNRTTPSKADHCRPEEETCIIIITKSGERERGRVLTSCGPQSTPTQEIKKIFERE